MKKDYNAVENLQLPGLFAMIKDGTTVVLVPHVKARKPLLAGAKNYPEEKVHPSKRSKILSQLQGNVIVTFSEEIVLALMKNIRESSGADSSVAHKHKLGVFLNSDGSYNFNIEWVKMDALGQLIGEWPDGSGGFFEHRLPLFFG